MKEVLTKKFWEGVKKTFDEALEGPPAKHGVDISREPEVKAEVKEVSATEAMANPHELCSGSGGADPNISLDTVDPIQ